MLLLRLRAKAGVYNAMGAGEMDVPSLLLVALGRCWETPGSLALMRVGWM